MNRTVAQAQRPGSIPDAIEEARPKLHVLRGVADRLVSKVKLDLAQIAPLVGEGEAGVMAKLVRMHQR